MAMPLKFPDEVRFGVFEKKNLRRMVRVQALMPLNTMEIDTMKVSRFAAALAVLASLLSSVAHAQTFSSSVTAGGSVAITEPVGGVTSFSVMTESISGGSSAIRASINQGNFSFQQSNNGPAVISGGDLSASGNLAATPGVRASITINRSVSPSGAPTVEINRTNGGSFNVAPTQGNVNVSVNNDAIFSQPNFRISSIAPMAAPSNSGGGAPLNWGGGFVGVLNGGGSGGVLNANRGGGSSFLNSGGGFFANR